MLEAAQHAQIRTPVREQQMRQRWRTRLLWLLRILSLAFLLLMLKSVLVWPLSDLDVALDACNQADVAAARECMRQAIDSRRPAAEEARLRVIVLVPLIALTFSLALLVRFGLRQQLQEQMRFAEQVFDAVPLPMSLRTTQGVFLRANAAAQQRLQRAEADVIGRHFSEFFPAPVVAAMQRLDAKALASAGPVEVEVDNAGPQGSERSVMRVQAVRDQDGAAIGVVTVRSDITALHQHRASLAASNERLRHLSAQMLQAQEQERLRIARDLHDQVGQILTALKLQLGSLARGGTIADAQSALLLPLEYADEALRHTRDLSASLHPHHLDDLGLQAALHWLTERFIRPLVPTIEVRCQLAPARGPAQAELVAFRVVQEALTNVVRHARASRIGVILEAADGQLAIEVIDDGVGFDDGDGSRASRAMSLGLAGMDDRVTELGGRLHVDSTPGAGTRVRASLPWPMDGGTRDESRSGG
jgi:two-component system sensor histidine kinase UhpB